MHIESGSMTWENSESHIVSDNQLKLVIFHFVCTNTLQKLCEEFTLLIVLPHKRFGKSLVYDELKLWGKQ